ncbi:MAG: ABC transporter permease [Steroidobacteraceae bacterium]
MWTLLWANLGRKRSRLILTLASITVAFILFSLVQALQYALVGGVELAGQDRLISMHKVSFTVSLPRSYLERMRAVEGVRSAFAQNWFGGYYKDERNQVGTFAILGEEYLQDMYPELILDPQQYKNWLRERTGALVGKTLAEKFGWKLGDVVPMRSQIWFKTDGTNTWDMKIVGIFDVTNGDNSGMYFHYDYFNESVKQKDEIGIVTLRLKNKDQAAQVASKIDELFTNSAAETKTGTEKAFVKGFANQFGNISAIVTVIVVAVFFTMLLVTANSMAQSVRERTSEIGVMKTLGFTSAQVTGLVLAESLLITTLGGVLGLTVGWLIVQSIAESLKQYLPIVTIPASAFALAAACIVILGVLSGAIPCWQAWRLKITDALRRV